MRVVALITGLLLLVFGGSCSVIFLATPPPSDGMSDYVATAVLFGLAPLLGGLLLLFYYWRSR